jgi:hypothetical protein
MRHLHRVLRVSVKTPGKSIRHITPFPSACNLCTTNSLVFWTNQKKSVTSNALEDLEKSSLLGKEWGANVRKGTLLIFVFDISSILSSVLEISWQKIWSREAEYLVTMLHLNFQYPGSRGLCSRNVLQLAY